MEIAFTVLGEAQPKGSTKTLPHPRLLGYFRRGQPVPIRSVRELLGAVIVTSDNPKVKSWQSRIAFEATCSLRGVQLELAGGIDVHIAFYLPRPSGLAKSYRGPHLKKPDLDKLLRAAGDALKGAVYADDSQVVHIDGTKHYAALGDPPRAVIRITPCAAPLPLLEEGVKHGV